MNIINLYYRLFINFFNLSIKINKNFNTNKNEKKIIAEAKISLTVYMCFFINIILIFVLKTINCIINPSVNAIIGIINYSIILYINNILLHKFNNNNEIKKMYIDEYKFALGFILLQLLCIPILVFL